MNERRNTTGFDRRTFLAGAAAACLAGAARGQENDPLQELIQRNQEEEFGQTFDAAANSKQMPTASLPTLSPATTQTTEAAVAQYEQTVARGGWPVVPPVQRLRVGMKHASVKPLRERLIIAGDLDGRSGLNDTYDTYVEAAVRRFQTRHGLSPDGVVREQTLRSLNVPAEARLNQLRTNVVRLRAFSGTLGPRFVMANIPAAWIEAVEGGVAVSRHTAVAGKPDRPSPDIQSKIVEINFNPYWNVPVSIVRKDLIPKMQAEPDYLAKYRIRIFDQRNNELTPAQINWYSDEAVNYRFKQDPGALNSLGTMRINFPSAHGVYMHDTPFKNLFGEDDRFHSSGCMRVQNVRDLVYWLLAETPGWSRPEIDQVIKAGERKEAKVLKPVPLFWVYVTAWATPDNVVQFRDDIYNRDGLGQHAASRG
ncbi:MAG: murein L,D-transpeptidase [Xanthobacteraceae bacterium]